MHVRIIAHTKKTVHKHTPHKHTPHNNNVITSTYTHTHTHFPTTHTHHSYTHTIHTHTPFVHKNIIHKNTPFPHTKHTRWVSLKQASGSALWTLMNGDLVARDALDMLWNTSPPQKASLVFLKPISTTEHTP